MEFELEDREIKLQGELWSPKTEQLHCLHVFNQQEADEAERKMNQLMPAVESELSICCEISVEEIWSDLNEILEKHAELFMEPKSLPPQRDHDHKMILKESYEAVNIKPYKYASQQKDAIESMIAEMLEAGIIRHSESPFSSPLVK